MSERHCFHLALPVTDLAASERFYVDVLGARIGRRTDAWIDVLVWGHQLTLHERPDEVLPREAQGKRHFGVTLPWELWESEGRRVAEAGSSFLSEPAVLKAGTPDEHAKFYLEDPDHHVIEVKAYRDAAATLGI